MTKSYQWFYNGSAIGGATGKTHTLTSGQTDSNLIECRTEVTYGTDGVAALAKYVSAAGAISIEQTVGGPSLDLNAWPYESSSITIGSASNRLLVACLAFNSGANGSTYTGIQADFGTASRSFGTGTSMTVLGPYNAGGRRPHLVFALLVAPTGTGTVMFNDATGPVTAGDLFLIEYSGASQTIGDHVFLDNAGGGATTGTSVSTTGTAVAGHLVSAVAVLGDTSTSMTATGDATLQRDAQAATSAFSSVYCGYSTEAVASGTDGNGFSWTTANEYEMATINIAEA